MDKYMWIAIIAIVVFMVIIGYIAEKTDFGRKEMPKKAPKEKKKDKIDLSKKDLASVVYQNGQDKKEETTSEVNQMEEIIEIPSNEINVTSDIVETPFNEEINIVENQDEIKPLEVEETKKEENNSDDIWKF